MADPRRVVMAFFFYPRGGSAHATRALCRALEAAGWQVTLVAGSLGGPGEERDASTFFEGIDVRPVAYDADIAGLHPPSYEQGAGLSFPSTDEPHVERLVGTWEDALDDADARGAALLHLHHLTPAHEAAARRCPGVPVVTHLHGSELAMLEWLAEAEEAVEERSGEWTGRLRQWARSSEAVVCPPAIAGRARELLGLPGARVVPLANGVDTALFSRRPLGAKERFAFWRRWLVEEPRGWDEHGVPGSVRYTDDDLAAFSDAQAVLVCVGRYLAVKRIPLLIRAHERARVRAPLVLVGGYPGEWEGPHPLRAVQDAGARAVFLAGPRRHEALPEALNASDLLVFPSIADSFGLPIVEAMACGVPAIAAAAGGPGEIVRDGETGWLVPPDDENALRGAIEEAVSDPGERRRRAEQAFARSAEWSWSSVAARLGALYERLLTVSGTSG